MNPNFEEVRAATKEASFWLALREVSLRDEVGRATEQNNTQRATFCRGQSESIAKHRAVLQWLASNYAP